jgi:hypothetical protein
MSKQTAILLILVVFLGALGALLWFYFSINTNNTQITTPVNLDTYDPFGTKTTNNTENTSPDVVDTEKEEEIITIPNKLRKISEDPISGFSVTENSKTKQIDIHYILRANGNIYETYTNSPESRRLSITTIPKVYESVWLPDGQRLIIRYLKDNTENIETFSVKINPATTTLNEFEGGVDGNHFIENISAIATNPLGDKIFYLTEGLSGSSGFIAKPDGLNKKLLFESPLTEWNISWPKEEIITMTTKPSAKISGYLYFLNSKTGSFSKIIGNINGLTTKINSTATEVLYSDSIRTIPRLYLFNIKNGESKVLPWETLPEKCLWDKNNSKVIYCAVPKSFQTGDYPDLWYQGLTSFSDNLWTLDTETMTATLLVDLEKETSNKIDVSDIQIDNNSNYLVFTNKTDLTLWSYNLK